MPIFNNEPKPKKSLREKLNSPSIMGMTKGGDPGVAEFKPTAEPIANMMEGIAEGQKTPDKSLQAKSLPTDEGTDVTSEDESVATYLQESQTLDGPETGKVKPEETPTPEAFAAFFRKWKSVPTEMNPKDRKMFTDKLAQLDQKMLDAETQYSKNKDRLAWAEAAEQLGHAIVQLMAGADASKNNWSVGGIKFDKNNWESKLDRALREYDSKKDTLSKQQSIVNRELDRADAKSEREGRSERSLMERDFFTTQARIEAQARRAAKEAEAAGKDAVSKERAAREKARGYIANYEAAEDAIGKLEKGDVTDPKEQQKLRDEITDALRKNGHIGVSKDLANPDKGGAVKTGGFLGFFQSDDYSKMRAYVEANKRNGIKSVYRGYGVPVPSDVEGALRGDVEDAGPEVATEQPAASGMSAKTPPASGEVERITPDGRTAIYNAQTKQFIRWK